MSAVIDHSLLGPPRARGGRALFAEGAAADLKRQSVRGGAVAITSQVVKFAVRMGSMMVLARVISPEDFGLQGMVVAITNFIGMFRDIGLSTVTVQREGLTQAQVSNLFWVNAAVGAALAAALVALAPGIAWFYKDPRLTWIAVVSAVAFVAGGLSVQHLALLQRQMRFLALAVIELVALAVSAVVAVVMAWAGWRYWSLVGMTVALPVVTAVGAWLVVPWTPSPPCRGHGLRSMLSFGGVLTVNSLVVNVASNLDKVLVGQVWGAAALGIYGRAFQLISLPSEQIIGAMATVAIPGLSRLQNSAEEFRRAFLRGYSVVLAMTVPVTITCGVFAAEIIRVMFGPKWSEAVPVFRLLAPTVLAFALINPFAWLLIASGRARRSLNMAFLLAPAMILGVVCGLRSGIEGVALGLSAALVLVAVPMIAWACAGTGITGGDIWRAARAPLVGGALAGGAGWAARAALPAGFPAPGTLALGGLAVAAVYGLVVLAAFRQWPVYRGLLQQLTGARRAPSAG